MARQFNSSVMNDLQGFFRKGERKRIYLACQNDRDKLLIALLWKSGRRIGEVLQLKVSDIDFENKDIVWNIEKKYKTLTNENNEIIGTQKIKMMRRKPATVWLLKNLYNFIIDNQLKPQDYIFGSSHKDGPITRQRAFQIVREASKNAGVYLVGNKLPHPHHFRHSFAIDLAKKAKSPADIRRIQMWLEHSSLDMTEQYLQFGSEDLREMLESTGYD